MMQRLLLSLGAAFLLAVCPAACETALPEPGLHVAYAITRMAARSASSVVYLQEARSGVRGPVYEDPEQGDRILTRIAGSDLVGAARATARGVYAIMGPSTASDPAVCSDALCRLDVSAGMYRPATLERLFAVPLCFSDESPYGLWNRAPMLAVSRDGRRFAMTALRIGESDLPVPTVRLLSATGEEEWQVQLEGMSLYVADLCWSPDGKTLAYIVMPLGDVHTLDEALLPKAGVYLADVERRSTRLLYHCFADALAWGPGADRITVAARVGDFWSARHVARVILCSSGKKVEEFSVRGSVQTLSCSEDSKWLAVQTASQGHQRIWLYAASGGWGRLLHEDANEGRLALLGWTRTAPGEIADRGRS